MAEFTPQQITWLERYMRLQVGRQVQQATSQIVAVAQPVGFWQIVPDDLTAHTGEYVYTHPVTGLTFLYCNGASVSQTTYATLYALWGTNKYGADSGGNFVLPDARGRSLWLAGTNAATDVGDNDGVTESSRQPAHTHTSTSLTVTGTPSITDPQHRHAYQAGTNAGTSYGPNAEGITNDYYAAGSLGTALASTGITAGLGSLDVGGTAGSGMNGSDQVAHLVLGSLVVRF